MTTRVFLAALLAISLAGCATYSNDYRDSYADGSYYSPSDGDNGDYYYAPERNDRVYSDGYYGGGYYDYRSYLGPIGYGSYDGYCSVRYSTCAPYWYGGYSPSYSRFGFSLIFGSYGGYGGYGRHGGGYGYSRPPHYGYGYRSQPIYRGEISRAVRPGTTPPSQPVNWNAYPARPGRLRPNRERFIDDTAAPGMETNTNNEAPVRIQPRPLYREAVQGMPARRPMPEPGFRSYREPTEERNQRPAPAPRPAYREEQPEPRVYRQPERAPPEMRPMREERRAPVPESDPGEAPVRGARRRNAQDDNGG
jgi:hypothetical protein